MARQSRRPDYSGEDQFVAGTMRFLAWAQSHSRALVLAGLALGILIVGVLYYRDYNRRVREAASTEIRAIRFQMQTGSTTDVIARIQSFLAEFEGTDYAREAKVLLAHSLLLQNRAGEAIEPARQAAERGIGDDVLATRAAFLLAAAYEEVGDTALAVSVYEEIGREARLNLQKRRGLEGAARLRAESGHLAQGAALYDELAELTPESSPQRLVYEMRAAELRARAAGSESGVEAKTGGP